MAKMTRLDYCQYLLNAQINYTLTHFASHTEKFSHDKINRYLAGDRITPRLVWDTVKSHLVETKEGYVIFDDTVIDKRHAHCIELARPQYSGNAKRVINGISIVTCVYVNPEVDRFWIIDYRIYHQATDGKSKLDHVKEMLSVLVTNRQLLFKTVLMDSWYAAKTVMLHIEQLDKRYYCPMKTNRKVDDSNGCQPYQRIDSLTWTEAELKSGKRIKLNGFPKDHKVNLFRVVSSNRRTDYVVTNDLSQTDLSVTQTACAWRWKIEVFHREVKQLTGQKQCQCRLARIVRNPIGCAFLVWIRLEEVAYQTQQTLYQVKEGLFSDYLRKQLQSPTVPMKLA